MDTASVIAANTAMETASVVAAKTANTAKDTASAFDGCILRVECGELRVS